MIEEKIAMLGPKEAARIAVNAIADIFDPSTLRNVKLEEYEMDAEENWLITVGYDAPVDPTPSVAGNVDASVREFLSGPLWRRYYKVISINRNSGQVQSMKIRVGVGA